MKQPSGLPRDREGGDRGTQAREQRDPLHARERAEQGTADDEYDDPDCARRGLHALAGVEDRTVAGEDLVDDAQIDERVLVHPSVLPTADRDHERGNVCRCGYADPSPTRRSVHVGFVVLVGGDQRRHRVVPRLWIRIQRA